MDPKPHIPCPLARSLAARRPGFKKGMAFVYLGFLGFCVVGFWSVLFPVCGLCFGGLLWWLVVAGLGGSGLGVLPVFFSCLGVVLSARESMLTVSHTFSADSLLSALKGWPSLLSVFSLSVLVGCCFSMGPLGWDQRHADDGVGLLEGAVSMKPKRTVNRNEPWTGLATCVTEIFLTYNCGDGVVLLLFDLTLERFLVVLYAAAATAAIRPPLTPAPMGGWSSCVECCRGDERAGPRLASFSRAGYVFFLDRALGGSHP